MADRSSPKATQHLSRGRLGRLFRLAVMMLLANLLVLGVLEGVLWMVALAGGVDARVPPPLPQVEAKKPLCPATSGSGLKLCASHGEGGARAWGVGFSEAPARPRIIVVGESFVHGHHLPREASWPVQLQAQLGGRYEVLNFGVCGSEMAGLEPVIAATARLKPRLVVLAIGNNEYTMAPYYGGFVGRHPALFYAAGELASATQLYGALRRWILPRVYGHLPASVEETGAGAMQKYIDALHGRPPRNLHLFPDMLADPQVTRLLEGTKRLNERWFRTRYREAARRLQARGVKVAMATLPRQLDVPPTLSGLNSGTRAQMGSLMKQLLDPGAAEVRPDFVARVEAALQRDPYLAAALYSRGRSLLRKGLKDEAIAHMRQASQWDLVPDVTPRINGIIRAAAKDLDAPLVDLSLLTQSWLGDERRYYKDPIHLSDQGAAALAKMAAKRLKELGY